MAQKIYVIMKGWYSDMSVEAATTDPIRAEELRRMHSDAYDDARIEEFEDGKSPHSHTPLLYFDVDLGEKGEVLHTRRFFDSPDLENEGARPRFYPDSFSLYNIRADDEENAIKIARDRRAELLAKDAGII